MLRLHYAPDNASLIVRLALEELGLAYETRLVDRATSAQKSPAYRALNPRGQIPVLETDDGPIFETAAILLWLTENAPDTAPRLAPPPGDPARGPFLSWLFALSNGMQADLRRTFYTERYVGEDPAAIAAHRALTQARIAEALDRFETLAGDPRPWFAAETPSILDLYLTVMLRWLALYPTGQTGWFQLARWPRLKGLAARVETRPAMRRAAAAEGLGPTPLTAPRPADPPEGSAL